MCVCVLKALVVLCGLIDEPIRIECCVAVEVCFHVDALIAVRSCQLCAGAIRFDLLCCAVRPRFSVNLVLAMRSRLLTPVFSAFSRFVFVCPPQHQRHADQAVFEQQSDRGYGSGRHRSGVEVRRDGGDRVVLGGVWARPKADSTLYRHAQCTFCAKRKQFVCSYACRCVCVCVCVCVCECVRFGY